MNATNLHGLSISNLTIGYDTIQYRYRMRGLLPILCDGSLTKAVVTDRRSVDGVVLSYCRGQRMSRLDTMLVAQIGECSTRHRR